MERCSRWHLGVERGRTLHGQLIRVDEVERLGHRDEHLIVHALRHALCPRALLHFTAASTRETVTVYIPVSKTTIPKEMAMLPTGRVFITLYLCVDNYFCVFAHLLAHPLLDRLVVLLLNVRLALLQQRRQQLLSASDNQATTSACCNAGLMMRQNRPHESHAVCDSCTKGDHTWPRHAGLGTHNNGG